MNKFLLIILLFLTGFFILFLNKKQEKKIDLNGEKITSNEIINKINEKIKKINSVSSKLIVKQGFFSTDGLIAYEKPNNFKMISNSYFGKELEIGSNDDFFWFFTRKMKPKALYYCELKDIKKTRLRPIFYPELLKGFLGINQITNYQNLIKKDDYYYLEENIVIGIESFNKITIIKNNKVIGYRLCKDYKIILEVDVIEFQFLYDMEFPKKIKINWIEESISQEWILENLKVNHRFYDWKMPEYKQKINLADY